MCGIDRIHRESRGRADPACRPPSARISRVRQRRGRHDRRRRRRLHLRKRAGRVRVLEESLQAEPAPGSCGMGHTRWATHGPATDRNAHPHVGGDGGVAVVHGRVIEEPRGPPQGAGGGRVRLPDADRHRGRGAPGRPRDGGRRRPLRGRPARPAEARRDVRPGPRQPEVSGPDRRGEAGEPAGPRDRRGRALPGERPVGDRPAHGEGRLPPGRRGGAPDPRRLRDPAPRARADHAEDRPDRLAAGRDRAGRLRPLHAEGDPPAGRHRPRRRPGPAPPGRGDRPVRRPEPHRPAVAARPPGRPGRLRDELARGPGGRVPHRTAWRCRRSRGSSTRAEFRYRNAPLDDRTLVFVLSQSGETADTLGALRESKRRGHPTLAICNVVSSTIAREADGGIYLHAGPEVGVASTKAFTAQVMV